MTFVIPANPTKEPRKYMVHHRRREQETPFQSQQGPNPWKVLLILVASFLCLVLLFFDHIYLIALEPPSYYRSIDNRRSSFAVDVLSIGSTDRWDFVARQQQTWGSHSSIRYFQAVNEGHHEAYGNSTCTELQTQVDECMDQHAKTPTDTQGRRYYVAPEMESLALVRNRPDGWWCAQRRHVIGLHRLFSQRYTYQQDYPDWLLIVDDDTFYNMTIFQHSLSPLDPNQVHVVVGRESKSFHWGDGGFGIALSRAALQRLYTPLHCRAQQPQQQHVAKKTEGSHPDLQSYMTKVCDAILQKNLIFENQEFQDGMSLLELMLAIQLHRRPFCWQGDWYLGWFLSHHVLLGERSPTPFPACPPYECRPHPGDKCYPDYSLVCHVGYVLGQ